MLISFLKTSQKHTNKTYKKENKNSIATFCIRNRDYTLTSPHQATFPLESYKKEHCRKKTDKI